MITAPQEMRAWRIHRYGGPEVMRFETVAVPAPGPGEILARVEAASVNPIDWKLRNGALAAMLPERFPRVLGRDCGGTIVALGAAVADLKPGDAVAGVVDMRADGTHAEFVVLPAAQTAVRPPGVSAMQGAALGVSGMSAFIPLVEVAQLAAGQRVLIHAGAGGVGSVAIRIARHLGAEVLTTCSAANRAFCESLGAQRAIDYVAEDFVAAAGPCDVVFDTVGGATHERSYAALKPGGVLVSLNAARVPMRSPPRSDVRAVRATIAYGRERMERLLAWAEKGAVEAVVGRTLDLAEAPAGYAASETGHARGKILLTAP